MCLVVYSSTLCLRTSYLGWNCIQKPTALKITKAKLKHAVFHRTQMARTRAYTLRCLLWMKSSGRPLMDWHNAPAVLVLSKGRTGFFHQNVFNKRDESRAAPRINMLKDACVPLGKRHYMVCEDFNKCTSIHRFIVVQTTPIKLPKK